MLTWIPNQKQKKYWISFLLEKTTKPFQIRIVMVFFMM
jgi:hypothetical protein